MDGSETSQAPFAFVYNYVDKDTLHKYLRLTIIVCLYVFLRSYYSNYAKQKEIQRKIDEDKREKALEKEKAETEEAETLSKLDDEAQTFGWGKATRRTVKRQSAALKQQAEDLREYHQSAYDAAEDHDIDDLLEDWVRWNHGWRRMGVDRKPNQDKDYRKQLPNILLCI